MIHLEKIIVGIPRAFLYYRYKELWLNYFENLDVEIVISPETDKNILDLGQKYSIDESCISSKIYLGHIAYLVGRCDYILVPRISDYGKNEKTCVKFNGQYDIIKNLFPNQKILGYNIEETKHNNELLAFLKIGRELDKNIIKVANSYKKAKEQERIMSNKAMIAQNEVLKSDRLKILVVAHPYNIYDKYIGEPIQKILNELDVELLYADKVNRKVAKKFAKKYSPTLYWTYSKELIGAIGYYYDKLDGIIFVTAFPCGPDSLVNELLIRKLRDVPITNILINESTAEAGLQTRLESFIDIIKGKREQDD